jgi:hypothetical protein
MGTRKQRVAALPNMNWELDEGEDIVELEFSAENYLGSSPLKTLVIRVT